MRCTEGIIRQGIINIQQCSRSAVDGTDRCSQHSRSTDSIISDAHCAEILMQLGVN